MRVISLNAKFTDEAPSSVPYRTGREKILGKLVFQFDPVGPSSCFQDVTVGAVYELQEAQCLRDAFNNSVDVSL